MAFLFYFHRMNFICLNGKILPADKPSLMADNRGYRYGDGLFETIKLIHGTLILEKYRSTKGNVSQIARELKMDRSHLYTKLKEYGLR